MLSSFLTLRDRFVKAPAALQILAGSLILIGVTASAYNWTGHFGIGRNESTVTFERSDSGNWKGQASSYTATVNSRGVSIPLPSNTVQMTIGNARGIAGVELQPTQELGQYRQLMFAGILPGVDAIYHGDGGSLEFDFVLAAKTDPANLRMTWTGQQSLSLEPAGNLLLRSGRAEVSVLRPNAWQERNGRQAKVDVAYKLEGNTVGFELGSYDRSLPVRIDPTILVSIPPPGRAAHAMAFGADGSLYKAGSNLAWVTKSNPVEGTELFRTNLASGVNDSVNALALDAQGHVHVGGTIFVNNAAQGFTAELDGGGKRIAFSAQTSPVKAVAIGAAGEVYFGGDAYVERDGGAKIAAPGSVNALTSDASGHIYAAGKTASAAYVARLATGGASWDWILPLGGSGSVNEARAIVAGTDGAIYVGGLTNSADFPVKSAYQNRMTGVQDAFVARVKSDGSGATWATYLGGRGTTSAEAMALNGNGHLLIAGATDGRGLPLAASGSGHQDGFFARFDQAGQLIDSFYLQSPGAARLLSVAVDSQDHAFVAGGAAVQGLEDAVTAQVTQSGLNVVAGGKTRTVSALVSATAMGTTITVAPSANPATLGTAVTLTATVTPSTATGEVTFYDGTTVLGVGTLTSGTATLSTIELPAGKSSLKAYYAGSATFSPSTSPLVSQTVTAVSASSFEQASGSPFTVGTMPDSVATGDFNKDGKADLAIVNYGSNNVTVLLGTGNGNFTQATGSPFATGNNPVGVAVADFNNDGNPDLVISNFSDNTLTILLGNGTGGFTPASGSPFAVGSGPRLLTVADFNGDGQADVAVVNYTAGAPTGTVSVLLGNGAGGFTAASGSPVTVGDNPYSIVSADFNGDGIPDLAVANQGGNNITVLLGSGSGTFTPATGSPFAVGNQPNAVATGDFNGDGFPDLAVANHMDSTVTILLGNGKGGFTQASGSPYTTDTGPYDLTVGDLNGDGNLDVAVANAAAGDVTVLIGNGAGAFTPETGQPFNAGSTSLSITVADFNGDGRTDMAVANLGSNNLTVLLGVGNATQLVITQQPTTGMVNTTLGNLLVAVEDSGGNIITGSNAVVSVTSMPAGVGGTVTESAVNGIATFNNLTFSATGTYTLTASSAGLSSAISAPITITGGPPSRLVIVSQPTSGTINIPLANIVVDIDDASGNLTNSNATVTVTSSPVGVSGTLSVQAVNGVATFSNLEFSSANLYSLTFASTGLASAKSANILVSGVATQLKFTAQPTTGQTGIPIGSVQVTVEDASGTQVSTSTAAVTISSSPAGVSGTLTVNAVSGLATFSNLLFSTGANYKLTATSPGLTSATSSSINVISSTTTVVTATPNPATYGAPVSISATVSPSNPTGLVTFRDGVTLLGDAPLVSGTATLSSILLPAGTTSLSAYYAGDSTHAASTSTGTPQTVNAVSSSGFNPASGSPISVGNSPDGVAIADFNGDGIPDMAIANFGSNNVTILLGNGTGGFTVATGSPVAVGNAPAAIAIGDFNDDGKVDLVVANSSDNTITILLGNGTGGFTPTAKAVNAGNHPLALAVADYNGDGKADVAIADYANNAVTVLLGNGAGQFVAATGSPFAVATQPFSLAVGDFNNDGIPDLAVDNQGSNNVTILLGSGTGTFAPTGNPVNVGNHPNSVLVADFNNDGFADFAVANHADNTVSVFLGNGTGTFTAASGSPFPTDSGPYALAMGDINGDGIVDLVVANGIGDFTVLLGSGNGNFTQETGSPFNAGSTTVSLGVADFNLDGRADIAGANLGSNNVTVLLGGAAVGPATKLVITSQPTTGSPGTPIGNVVVEVQDANNNLVTTSNAVISMASTPTGVSGTLTQTASGGIATFTGLTFSTAGTYTLNATSAGLQGASSMPIVIASSGPATKLVFTTQPPSTGTAGTAIGNVVVTVEDMNGNPVTGSTASITISSSPSGVSGTLTMNATGGVATFNNLVFTTATSYTLTAMSTGLTSATSTPIAISAGPATKLVFTTEPPATGTVNTAIGNVVVQVQDANGNLVTTSNASVTIASTPTGVSGTLTVTASGGIATFTNLMFSAANTYTLTASSTGLASATSTSIVISSGGGGGATQLAFSAEPTTGTAGTAIGTVSVKVENSTGHVVTGSNAAVTITSSPAGVTGTTTVDASSGIATFTNLIFDKVGKYTLTASSPGLTSATSTRTITISAGPAAQLAFTARATGGTAGTLLAPFDVQVQDAEGNPITTSTAAITLMATGPGTFTSGSTTTVNATAGVAKFTNLTLDTAGSYTVTATSTGLTSATSPSFTVNAAAATQLVFTVEPKNGTVNTKLAAVRVEVQDAFGNQVRNSTASVTMAANGPGTFTSGSTTTVSAVSGIATFSNLILATSGTYTMTATSSGLTNGVSTSFMVAQ